MVSQARCVNGAKTDLRQTSRRMVQMQMSSGQNAGWKPILRNRYLLPFTSHTEQVVECVQLLTFPIEYSMQVSCVSWYLFVLRRVQQLGLAPTSLITTKTQPRKPQYQRTFGLISRFEMQKPWRSHCRLLSKQQKKSQME